MAVKYFNAKTNEEIVYGQHVNFKFTDTLPNGFKFESSCTLPIVNGTIPFLIEKGLLVQKEVKEKKAEPKNKQCKCDKTIDEKLDIIAHGITCLLQVTTKLLEAIEGDTEDEDIRE